MAPEGFEPSTPALRGQCSNQTELRSLCVSPLVFLSSSEKSYGAFMSLHSFSSQVRKRATETLCLSTRFPLKFGKELRRLYVSPLVFLSSSEKSYGDFMSLHSFSSQVRKRATETLCLSTRFPLKFGKELRSLKSNIKN